MSLFQTQDTPVSRRLLLGAGILMLVTGLLMSLFMKDDRGERDVDEAAARAELIHEQRSMEDRGPAEPSEFDRKVAAIDLTGAPEPRPQRVDDEDFDLYVNTTAEFLTWFFEEIGYTAEAIDAGETDIVPPLVLVSISKGWAEDKTVQLKKSLFYRVVLPLVLLENDAVLAERATLEAYRKKRLDRAPVTPEELEAVRALAIRYGVIDEASEAALEQPELAELLRRVDIVPPSLALGQAAYESGYATSRFAHTGNALFGQWDWSADAIKPEQQRSGMGNYGIKAFEYPIDSVRAYLWNLNTHRAYADFRAARERMRAGRTGFVALDGHALAATLTAYSERGAEYTEDLQGIIRFNQLARADDLGLIEGDPVYFD